MFISGVWEHNGDDTLLWACEKRSLRKVLRRFVRHDRTHTKAMCRMVRTLWGVGVVPDPFVFEQNT